MFHWEDERRGSELGKKKKNPKMSSKERKEKKGSTDLVEVQIKGSHK